MGPSRLSTTLTEKKVSWPKLAARLQRYQLVDTDYKTYMTMPRDQQASLKDVGYFIGGRFSSPRRLQENLIARCVISLDLDHLDWLDLELVRETYADYEHVVHSTMKHSDENPRLRIIFPLDKECLPQTYEPIARRVASWLDMEAFDDTTFQPARIMFWPAVTSDGAVFKYHNKGAFLSTAELEATYEDILDFGVWPHSSRVDQLRGPVAKAEDPLSKPGVIGAFNRTFDIHSAIARFELPYQSTDFDNRYLPDGATGAPGAVVYDDLFLYSNHESDVVGLQNVNAWDLVRLHRFGDLDAGIGEDVRMMDRPSSKEMSALAMSLPEIEQELKGALLDELPDKPNGQDHSPDALRISEAGSSKSDLTFKGIMAEISEIEIDSTDVYDVCQSKIPRIAAARLEPQENSIVAGALREKYPAPKPSKASVEKSIQVAHKRLTATLADGEGGISDIEQDLVQAVLDDHFSGGKTIKRIGRKYWTYQNGLWRISDDEWIKGATVETLTRLRVARPEDVLELVAAVGDSKTSTLMRALFDMQSSILAHREQGDDPLGLMRKFPLPIINCLNCELHFDYQGNMTVKDHNPDSFYTLRIQTEYDEKAKCPEWDRFNEIIWADSVDPEDMQRHLEELGGYIIQFSRWLKTWVLFHGPKDAGKSTVAMLLQQMLGPSYTGKPMAKLAGTSEFAESSLIGKLLMVDDDFAYDGHLPDGFLKTYSEEKAITASIKYGEDVNFQARSLPLILSNHWPVTRDVTGAFLERALIFPFRHRITGRERSDERREKMLNELPGILNKFIRGLSNLRKRGTWDIPLDCNDAVEQWRSHANPALAFVRDCLEIGLPDEQRVARSRIYQIYKRWDFDQGGATGRFTMKKGQFFERMSEILGAPVKTQGVYHFLGISEKKARIDELEALEDDDDFSDIPF